MATKPKKVRCPECGVKYGARRLRCPECLADNPEAKRGISANEQIFGIVLLVVGLLLFIPVIWFITLARAMGGFGGLYLRLLLLLFPAGLTANGLLLLMGIHPKDLWEWWNNRSDLTRSLVGGGFVVLLILIFVLSFFGGMGGDDRPHFDDFDDDFDEVPLPDLPPGGGGFGWLDQSGRVLAHLT